MRPATVCYCGHVTPVPTETRVVVLQHPRERNMPIGTARMATLCLPGSELHEGVRWDDAALERILFQPPRVPVLLYPGEGAVDVVRDPPRGPVTLVVLDGTWWQAKKILRENPRLQALPRYAFAPPAPSEYRIRREPDQTYTSTIEAIALVLGAIEGDASRFEPMLRPFRVMVDTQIACEHARHGTSSRHLARRSRPRPARPHPLLSAPAVELVCVAGEANAWPFREREPGVVYEDELVHWVACRLSTGESFERVVAPARPLAERTPAYVELAEEALLGGGTRAQLLRGWRQFVREGDVVCHWGRFAADLFLHAGGHLPEGRLDLRSHARDHARARVGSLAEYLEAAGIVSDAVTVPGRAGRRLAELCAVARHHRQIALRAGKGAP
jgi:DTW domain-containing protein YfiP